MTSGAVQTAVQQLASVTQNYGVFGLGIGMFLESLGIPFASALVALTAGTLIASGKASFWEALIISTAGLTLGSLVSYYIGFLGGRVGRCFSLFSSRKPRGRFSEQYLRYGEAVVIFAQLFGTTRTWVSLPAGAMKMKVQKFIAYTALGGVIYCALAIGFSVVLTGFLSRVSVILNSTLYFSLLITALVLIIAGSVYYFVVHRKNCTGGEQQSTE